MIRIWLACLLLLAGTTAEASSTLRCGSALISLGDTAGEVQNKCGEPVNRSELGHRLQRDEHGLRSDVGVAERTYGTRSGMYHILRLEGGRLRAIRSERNL